MRLKVKGILYDAQQVTDVLLGESETSQFLKVLDTERPLKKVDLSDKDLDEESKLEDNLMIIKYWNLIKLNLDRGESYSRIPFFHIFSLY